MINIALKLNLFYIAINVFNAAILNEISISDIVLSMPMFCESCYSVKYSFDNSNNTY